MGFLDKLFGGGQQSVASRGGYDELVYWIETRIGSLPPDDPTSIPRLQELIRSEKERLSRPFVRLIIDHRGGNTFISGRTSLVRNKLKRLGCVWDKRERAWVAHGRLLTEADIWKQNTSGLEAYLRHIEYRQRLN